MTNVDINIPQITFPEDAEIMEERTRVFEPEEKPIMPIKPLKKKFNYKKAFGTGGAIAVLFVLLIIALVVMPILNIYKQGKILADSGKALQASVAEQNIEKIKPSLSDLQTKLKAFQSSYSKIAWMKIIPVAGTYWNDGMSGIKAGLAGVDAANELIVIVEPYADIIGFTGDPSKKAQSGEDSANDRIEFLVQTIGQIAPKLESISQKALVAKAELAKIDPNRYPEEFKGIRVREKMKSGFALVNEAVSAISDGKPLLEMAPYLLGTNETRTYLVLFQNDKELRPTGGFLTAYSVMKVTKGKMQPVSSSDIYSLDAKYKPAIQAPEEFRSFIKGPYSLAQNFYIRDLNWNPDFKQSMDLFSTEAKKAGVTGIDGIIAVDTHVVVKILDVLGEIGVPGFGNFSTKKDPRCDCPQVIYELESFADVEGPVVWSENDPTKIVFAPKNYGKNRKEIVGPLMNSVLANALGQPKEKLPQLFQAGWDVLMEKHVMVYLFDEKAQKAAESFGIAGRMSDFSEGDYLLVNDANLGGRKSNLYVTQEVNQEYSAGKDGMVEKTVTITYKNSQPQDGWLNSVLPNWTRVYVPKGSTLISADGFEVKKDPYEESEKTVFAGGFKLRPQGVAKIVIKYNLPFKVKGEFKLMVQKQPGTDMPLHTISIGRQKEEIYLKTDKEFMLKF